MGRTRETAAWHDLTLSVPEIAARAQRWVLFLAAGTLLLFVARWGLPALPGWGEGPAFLLTALVHTVLFGIIYAVSAVLHEGLHAVGMMLFAGVSWRSIRFGLRLRQGVAYVHTHVPMRVRAYRRVLVLPGLVQGALPIAAGLAAGSGWLTFYGFVMLASAAGDYAVLRLLRPLPGDALVRDHPREVGCQVQVDAGARR